MQGDTITQTMAELGNETRLTIFRLLVKYGDQGLSVGSIGRELDIPASTLAFHLKGLVRVGLVTQHKKGRSIICFPQIDVLRQALLKIEAECCTEIEDRNVSD